MSSAPDFFFQIIINLCIIPVIRKFTVKLDPLQSIREFLIFVVLINIPVMKQYGLFIRISN